MIDFRDFVEAFFFLCTGICLNSRLTFFYRHLFVGGCKGVISQGSELVLLVNFVAMKDPKFLYTLLSTTTDPMCLT